MDKLLWNIDKLREWEKNPRTISKENFERLKNQIKELGEYKPLIITKDGTVLGGNMRLKAYRELGYKKVWVSIVEAETDEEKLKYALSDNDQLGEYQKDELIKLINNFPNLDLSNFTINLEESISLNLLKENLNIDLNNLREEYSQKEGKIHYEPSDRRWKIEDLYEEFTELNEEIEKLPNEKMKKFLKARVYNFYIFHFDRIADYYVNQATPEEKKLFEKLALVLLDKENIIKNNFSLLIEEVKNFNE
jgi:hypothetical protein